MNVYIPTKKRLSEKEEIIRKELEEFGEVNLKKLCGIDPSFLSFLYDRGQKLQTTSGEDPVDLVAVIYYWRITEIENRDRYYR